MSKQFLAVLAAIVLIFVGVFVFSNKDSIKSANTGKNSSPTLTNHVQGTSAAGVTLVEYGDFQCPYCEQYAPTVKTIISEFQNQVVFQFRNFPLTNLHPNAFAAARAAEAAGLQNKYWEMHDQLYESANWQVWTSASDPTTVFNQIAGQIGLKLPQFKADFASSKVNNLIKADSAEGTRLGVQGTPSFFLNGKLVTIANTPAAFEKVLKAELAKKQPASSTPAATPAPASTTETVPATTEPVPSN